MTSNWAYTRKFIKNHPLVSCLLVVWAWAVLSGLLFVYGLFLPNPFKVTDPSSPWFNASKFDLNDYPRGKSEEALKKLFPIGTDKSFVDFVMYSSGARQTSLGINTTRAARYDYRPMGYFSSNSFVLFGFDEHGKLLNVYLTGRPGIYEDQPKFEDFLK